MRLENTWRALPALVLTALAGVGHGCASPDTATSGAPVITGPLVVQDLGGNRLDLDATLAAGRPVALIFWQTWCESCKREAPALARAARDQAGRIDFVGVVPGPDENVDDDEVGRLARELDLPYPQVRDRDLRLSRAFAVTGTPTIIVLGQEREVLYNGHGEPASWAAFAAR